MLVSIGRVEATAVVDVVTSPALEVPVEVVGEQQRQRQ